MKTKIKKNDRVVVISGVSKGATGRVLYVNRKKYTALIEGVNMCKKHTKPSKENKEGGIIEKEGPIHLSNVMLTDGKERKRKKIEVETENIE